MQSATAAGMQSSHISASLEDFEHNERPAVPLRYPTQRSGFLRDSLSSGDDLEAPPGQEPIWPQPATDAPWPARESESPGGDWRNQDINGGGWYRHLPYLKDGELYEPRSGSGSPAPRSGSGSLADLLHLSKTPAGRAQTGPADIGRNNNMGTHILAASIPLPKGSLSPAKLPRASAGVDGLNTGAGDQANAAKIEGKQDVDPGSYVKIGFNGELRHRIEPLTWLVALFHPQLDHPAKRRMSVILWSLLITLLIWPFLTQAPVAGPAPDLVRLAGLARSLEPLMYYSENGVQHLSELQETGVAVWDLGESVRVANMSGAPTIVRELDDLAESLQSLSTQLTQFFPAVDSDIDNVLLVMEWAKRELAALHAMPVSRLASAIGNVHSLANALGLLENRRTGLPTMAGRMVIRIAGMTPAQRARTTLQRTFNELLGALEESINTELGRTASLFALFATIDGQFHNLQRLTVRELDEQERQESVLLSSLWQRVMGTSGGRLKKFEKNRAILQSVRSRTVANKNLLVEHNGKLLALKESLETLRRRLMSPLVIGSRKDDNMSDLVFNAGSSASLEAQINGLHETHSHLRQVRQSQRAKVMESLYGSGNRVRAQRFEIDG